MSILLLILGVVLVVAGVAALLRRQLLWGVVLVVVGVVLLPSSFVGL
ncbi:GPGG-motif small membrane protein [Thermobifida cellulosilytica]|uniref:Membrane protein n=1 Tax=Thermobifida cellulosilytica TB100 TaxID=665004 RepID=A0A147KDP4_THECS|nr:GPGG-motif small membrane protein [Thermobifida cellulosilytica]KUP95388.1 membrane protein [Thermobifida cellulosilytica TB100]